MPIIRVPPHISSLLRLSELGSFQLFSMFRYGGFLLTGIAFARMGLPKSEIGQYEHLLWVAGLLSFSWLAGLSNYILSDFTHRTTTERRTLWLHTFYLTLGISSIAAISCYIYDKERYGWLALYLMLNNVSYLNEYILFLNNKYRALVGYGVLSASMQILCCIIPAYLTHQVYWAVVGLCIVAACKTSYLLYQLWQYRTTSIQLKGVTILLMAASPLIGSFFISGSAEYIDGAVVQHYFTLADFSVFRYGSREFPLFSVLAASLSAAMIPSIVTDMTIGLETVRTRSRQYAHYFFPIAILLTFSGRWLFSQIFSPAFAASGVLFSILMLLTIPRLVFPQTIFIALKQSRYLLYVSIIEMIVNIVASIYLAQILGLNGVVYGTVIAFCVEKLLLIYILSRRFHVKPSQYIPLSILCGYGILLILAHIASWYI